MPFGVAMPQEEASSVKPSTAAGMATGLLRGSDIADVLGYLPDYEGGRHPSVGQNVQAGKYGQAGLQTLGLAGDLMYAIPAVAPLGVVAKELAAAGKPVQEATKTAEEARAAFHDFANSLGETHGQAGQPATELHSAAPEGTARASANAPYS
jgi:hypothetical protein